MKINKVLFIFCPRPVFMLIIIIMKFGSSTGWVKYFDLVGDPFIHPIFHPKPCKANATYVRFGTWFAIFWKIANILATKACTFLRKCCLSPQYFVGDYIHGIISPCSSGQSFRPCFGQVFQRLQTINASICLIYFKFGWDWMLIPYNLCLQTGQVSAILVALARHIGWKMWPQ